MNSPRSVVCTVFEGIYHYGVGALANSLWASGYRGTLYVGYRGALPPWATPLQAEGQGSGTFSVAPGLDLFFALQETQEMLANIKPELIEQVWERYGTDIDRVYYVDCDIVIKAEWSHFEDWAGYGLALVEDMNSPLHRTHPLRRKWKAYYAGFGIDYEPRDDVYVNGGFVGMDRSHRPFAELWKQLQDQMKLHTGEQHKIGIANRWNMFHFMDQDALNVAKDLYPDVSIMGPRAMDFGQSGYVMSHAAGRSKPWQKAFIRNVLSSGERPSFTDKIFWQNVSSPIRLYPESTIKRKRLSLKVAALIGRVFTRM